VALTLLLIDMYFELSGHGERPSAIRACLFRAVFARL
jgi:hypothetical protein